MQMMLNVTARFRPALARSTHAITLAIATAIFAATFSVVGVIHVGMFATPSGAEPAPTAENRSLLRIEAEDFDRGADDDYYDTDPQMGNSGRPESVDVWVIDNVAASGAVVGRTRAGEYTNYTFDLNEGGNFAVRLSIASGFPSPGEIEVAVDGHVIGSVEAADNGQWFGWTAQRAGEIELHKGQHTITTTWLGGANINFDWLDLISAEPSAPTCSLEYAEAELGQVSGRFHTVDDDAASGGAYVEVPHGAGGAWNGATDSYVEVCIGLDHPATYRLDARLRTPSAIDNSFYVSVDGGSLIEFVAPVTGEVFALARVGESGILDPLRSVGPTNASSPAAMEVAVPTTWDLDRGDHYVRFYVRRDGAQLDNVAFIVDEPIVDEPSGCRIDGAQVATRLSQAECTALLRLFEATGGKGWTTNTGWGTPTDPCGWYRVECSDSAVTALYLFDSGLTGTIPPELFDLRQLRVLDLGSNALTGQIPPGLGNLQGLDGLFLDDNQLQGALPAELGLLSELRNLYVSHNQFDGALPPEIGDALALQNFYATGNQLAGPIPGELGNLFQLQILGLRDNRLSGDLPDGLGRLESLQTLDLYRNQLTGTLPDSFANLRSLTYLSVLENQLSGDISVPMDVLQYQLLNAEFADGPGGNNCLTVGDSYGVLRDWLGAIDPGWDRCDVVAVDSAAGLATS